MEIIIKKYCKSYFLDLAKCMQDLQEYLESIDPLKRIKMLKGYPKAYANELVKKVKKEKGIIFLAFNQKKVSGCIAGIIEKQSKTDLLGCIPTKSARVLELVVSNEFRNCGIGKILMQEIENYFKSQKCDIIKIEVFEPNQLAYNFYKKLGYQNRAIDLIKNI